MYDPTIGRWISEDPLGFETADANLYRYVGNSPVNWLDPTGLQSQTLEVAGGTLTIAVGPIDEFGLTSGVRISFTGPNALKQGFFKVKQWMQLEVYAIYCCPAKDRKGQPYFYEDKVLLPAGLNLELRPQPGEKPHGHPHESASPYKPTLQVDHGNSTDEYSAGKYSPDPDPKKNTNSYTDIPNAAQAVFPQAAAWVLSKKNLRRKECRLDRVRVVQRFVTVVFLGGLPYATVHWTSTAEAPPGEMPGPPKAELISWFQGGKYPEDVVKAAVVADFGDPRPLK